MVRELNLLLFEIAVSPRSDLIVKENPERLFPSEIGPMYDNMEELRFAGQRMPGGFHQLDNLTADLEVGWA